MSKTEQEEKYRSPSQNIKRYENLNNNELKFKKKIPSPIVHESRFKEKEREKRYDDSYDYHDYSSERKRYNNSRSRSYSRKKHSSSKYKSRHSYYDDDRKYERSHRHHRHHRHRRHHKDYSERNSHNRNRWDDEDDSVRKQILKNNSLNVYLQGKSSNIFYDDNYLPLSSNPYKYLGKPELNEAPNLNLDKIEEIPISVSDICKKDFELYVLNLPQDLTEDQIKELLNTALISIEANEKKGDPITKVTKPKNGNFFILEFRTRTECKNAMNLNGMKILSRTLKIGVPNYLTEKDKNNYNSSINNINNGVHDLFPILSSFEKEFDYKKGYGIDNTTYNNYNSYSSKMNNLLTGQNLLYNIPLMNYSSNNMAEQKKIEEENNQPEPGSKLHIINIPLSFCENDVYKLFKKFGKIKKIEMIQDAETKKFNGQCYLEYEKEKSYQDAINYATGLKLGDNFLLINRVNPKEDNKINATKINYLENTNYKNNNSALGILGSSINLQSYLKK